MICLRCGYCCHSMLVGIVDDPAKGIIDGNIITHSGNGTPCKHLKGDTPGKYSCGIHEMEWYYETPCSEHTQFERTIQECRVGRYYIDLHNKKKEGTMFHEKDIKRMAMIRNKASDYGLIARKVIGKLLKRIARYSIVGLVLGIGSVIVFLFSFILRKR